jgi:hypothetical protein
VSRFVFSISIPAFPAIREQRLFKTGGRRIWHARYYVLQLAGSHQLAASYLTGSLFRQILRRIERLAAHPT